MTAWAEKKIKNMLEASGCEVNGANPWDPQIQDERTYDMVYRNGTLGAGESYMYGYWDCARLDQLTERVAGLNSPIKRMGWKFLARVALSELIQNHQSPAWAKRNAEHHYNIGNDLYQAMLGETMAYSCAYWKDGDEVKAQDLDAAQTAKFDLICRKLKLTEGMRLLDIGCGWGGLLSHAAKNYGVQAYGITPASEQAAHIRANNPEVKVKELDWRQLEEEQFDRVVSVGMFEHVGPKNYCRFFDKTTKLLKVDGMSLLHTIGAPHTRFYVDPFINKYIFPGGHIPSKQQIVRAAKGIFNIVDWHEIGKNYDNTLMAWNNNFQQARPVLSNIVDEHGNRKYNEQFMRMWEYYLQTSAGAFRIGTNLVFQAVLQRPQHSVLYNPVR